MPDVLCVGLTTIDVSYRGVEFMSPGTKSQADDVRVEVGGPAANAAIAAATFGSSVALCSALGRGPLAELARIELQGNGIEILTADTAGQLPVSSVLVDSHGERTVVSATGTGLIAGVPADLVAIAASSRVVLVDGHYPDQALTALKSARRARVTTVIDLGSWKSELPDLLPLCDIAIASADFAIPDGEFYAYLFARGVSFAATSHGGAALTWRRSSGEVGAISIPPAAVIDTNGAGDVLHGAFASLLAVSLDQIEALAQAAQFATASCEVWGARIPPAVAATLGRR